MGEIVWGNIVEAMKYAEVQDKAGGAGAEASGREADSEFIGSSTGQHRQEGLRMDFRSSLGWSL